MMDKHMKGKSQTPENRRRFMRLMLCFLPLVLLIGISLFVTRYLPTHSAPMKVRVVAPLTPQQFQQELVHITSLMQEKGVEAAFTYTVGKIAADPSFAKSCHPLLHELGHVAYAYYGGYAPAIKYQNEICDSGYAHGVLEEYLTRTPISEALTTACSVTTLDSFEQWQCYHGLGHGVMLVSLENVLNSLKLCGTLPTSFAQSTCANGVFMQHFVVTSHDGTIPAKNPTSLSDCHYTNAEYQADCYWYAPSAYLTVYNGQYAAALAWCNGAQGTYKATCVGGVGGQVMKENITNPDVSRQICEAANTAYISSCIKGAVMMFIFFHASTAMAPQLCATVFNDYKEICQEAISAAQSSFKI